MIPTHFPEPCLIKRTVFRDDRGSFVPAFDAANSPIKGQHEPWILQNCSESLPGTLRGLHYQAPSAQSKLITVLKGEIQDLILDLRTDSPSFGQVFEYIVQEGGENQLFVPKGFAHGFLALGQESAIVTYLADAPFIPEEERAYSWKSPLVKDRWLSRPQKVSPRDAEAPLFLT